MLISLSNIQKIFDGKYLLNDVTFTINEGDKVALVGLNGCGKTTIFKIISELENYDNGEIFVKKGISLSYLEQIPEYDLTVKDVIYMAFKEIELMSEQLTNLEQDIKVNPSDSNLVNQYGIIQNKFQDIGGYNIDTSFKIITNGLKINENLLQRNFMTLSGGEKSRVLLAKILLEKPDCLLLDEPTNHLDMDSITFLENYLSNFEGAVLVISHDRYFLDKLAKTVINIEDGKTYTYKGNYSNYLVQKQLFVNQRLQEYEAQTKKIKKLEEQIQRFKMYAKMGGGSKMDKKAKSRINALKKIDTINKPQNTKSININFNKTIRSSKEIIKFKNYSKHFDNNSLITSFTETIYSGDKVFLIGKNGTGKTTLMKSLMNETDFDGELFIAPSSKISYFKQEITYPDKTRTVLQEMQNFLDSNELTARTKLASFLFIGDDVFKKLGDLSGGEKAKLELCKLVNSDANVLLLDEPTNHLDIESKELLELALESFEGTILCVSHDRYFILKLCSYIYELENKHITKYESDFDLLFNKIQIKEKVVKEVKEKPKQKLSNNRLNELNKKYSKIEIELDDLESKYKEELSKENIDFTLIEELQNLKESLEIEAIEILEILEENS